MSMDVDREMAARGDIDLLTKRLLTAERFVVMETAADITRRLQMVMDSVNGIRRKYALLPLDEDGKVVTE